MKSPLDNTGGDSALKSAFDLVLYGLNQSPIVAIFSPLHRFEMAQMGPFLTMLMSILVLVRGLFQIINAQKSSYKKCCFRQWC